MVVVFCGRRIREKVWEAGRAPEVVAGKASEVVAGRADRKKKRSYSQRRVKSLGSDKK